MLVKILLKQIQLLSISALCFALAFLRDLFCAKRESSKSCELFFYETKILRGIGLMFLLLKLPFNYKNAVVKR